MKEFWEESFINKQEMWGWEAAKSAEIVKNLFVENSIKNVLIPGFGYGRNAGIFMENGMTVTGIEISKTAIDLAHKHFESNITIHHGSVNDMPFDDKIYDGIFCYGLIHLLDEEERAKLIKDCYNQLSPNGLMVFTAITQDAQTYGQGTEISKNRFEMFGGVKLYFYNKEAVQQEFNKAGLYEIEDITENYPFYIIKCRKDS
jgi:2-polyprenyl-3-methyl-5-hydroxy-6-metoxy-1,4-benzoquinol methylase